MSAPELVLVLGPNVQTAWWRGHESATVTVSTPLGDKPRTTLPPVLGRIEAELRERLALAPEEPLARGGPRVTVVLLPPLADLRMVDLPPLRPGELRSVLRRDAHRHFVGRTRPLTVGGHRFDEADAGPTATAAAAAPRDLVHALVETIQTREWRLERIVPAQAAWLQALDATPGVVIARVGDTAHLIRTRTGAPVLVRRLPAGDISAIVGAAGADPGHAMVLGPAGWVESTRTALRTAGWVDANPADTAPEAVAALHAARARPELIPEPLARARRQNRRRTVVRLLAVALVLVAASAVVHLWGTARELTAVQNERSELRGVVEPALAARDSLDRMTRRLQTLQTISSGAPRLSYALVELSMVLPSETWMISLQTAGDTLVLDAEGGRAGDALNALRNASFRDVRLEGTIQREIEAGATTRERFTLSAIMGPDASDEGALP